MDTFGKQDPFIKFIYDEVVYKSTVAKDAGLNAKFTDEFFLEDIEQEINKNSELVLEAYDEDVASDDLLGVALPISIVKLIQSEQGTLFDIDIYLECKRFGNIKFTSTFIYNKPDPPPNPLLNPDCRLNIVIKTASFLKNADMFGN